MTIMLISTMLFSSKWKKYILNRIFEAFAYKEEFRFGGCGILLFFMKASNVTFDDDLIEMSLKQVEIIVHVNTRIGRN